MRIKSVTDLLPDIQEWQKKLGLNGRTDFVEAYRGQSIDEYKLLPGISRYDMSLKEIIKREKILTTNYYKSITNKELDFIQDPFPIEDAPYQKEWFYLFQGQHLGLKTRLIDWTISWEAALLFAVENERYFGIDGQFWILIFPTQNFIENNNIRTIYNINPLDVENSYLINQPFYQFHENEDFISEQRRIRQYGRFTVQKSDLIQTPLENQPDLQDYLFKYIVDGNSKKRIKSELLARGHDINWNYYRKSENIDTRMLDFNKEMIK